jgi:hypothetical protein
MPGRRGKDYIPVNQHRILEFGAGLTATTNYNSGYRGQRTETTTIAVGACPGPMTRADLLALRTAGTLDVNCAYIITDHTQGNITADRILLRAVDNVTLSMNATVYVTGLQFNVPDNSGWKAIYDIDTNLLTEVWDNRGNHVKGATAVTAFPWGNTAFANNEILGTVLTIPYGQTTLSVSESSFQDSMGGGVNFTGTGGLIFRSYWRGGGTLNLSGATNIQITNSEFHGNTVNAVGHTSALFRINGSRLEIGGQIISSTNVQFTFGFGKVSQGSIVNHTAGQFDGLNCLIENFSRIDITGTNVVSFQSSRIAEQSTLTLSAPTNTTTFLASTVAQLSTVTITGARTQNVTYARNFVSNNSAETITGTGATALVYQGNNTSGVSTKTLTNCSVNHQNNFVMSGSSMICTSNTGNKSGNTVTGQSTLTIPANTLNVINNTVSEQYSLNTGAFSATNVRARGLATTTLTANNANRYVDAGTLGLI